MEMVNAKKEAFTAKLNEALDAGGSIEYDEPMSLHTTFRIGGAADYFITPATAKELAAAIEVCRQYEQSYYVIGNGSNLLVSDKGFRGVIFHIGKGMDNLTVDGHTVLAGAGASLAKMASMAANAGLFGLEFAGGIPGSVGGAVMMNAGAYGGEIKDTIQWAKVLWESGEIVTLSKEALELSYRHSVLMEKKGIVLEAAFLLQEGTKEEILAKMQEYNASRREKQPLNYPSAGSTFKRPEGYFAGKLIMDAGLRGFRIGDAMVSEKHCGFVINAGHATAAEVKELMTQIDDKVYRQFGVHLEPEVRLVGEW